MGDSNSKSSHSDCLKQAKALVFWHLGLGSPQKQSLRCRPVIWEIISENKSEARRWRRGKSIQGYSVGTGGSIPVEFPEKRTVVFQNYSPEGWRMEYLSAGLHLSLLEDSSPSIF